VFSLFSDSRRVNERCIELLVNAARSESTAAFPLVRQLRDALKMSDPEIRRRAAGRSGDPQT
jgi:hypothetical protein